MRPTARRLRPPLSLFNSLQKRIEPIEDRGVACYICGPTTYAPSHLGHARTYVSLDILRRVLAYTTTSSTPPLFVLNITDVDDKILAAAPEDPLQHARRYEAEFWRDWDALHCLRPHVVTRVSEHVESTIVPYIERLVDRGMAYHVPDHGVYFDVRALDRQPWTKYGKLAAPTEATDLLGHKRDSRDFALWKERKPSETLYWSSPWGDGRPGWHIECSAMIEHVAERFRDTHQFVLHAGGIDLQFPHHTNEIAQAEAYHGREWIPHWIHTGHLHIDGLKMSKSLKNFITIEELLHSDSPDSPLSSPADDFRLWCLGLSYRGGATFTFDRIDEARDTRQKIVRALMDAETWLTRDTESTKYWSEEDHRFYSACSSLAAEGLAALCQDLDGATYLEKILRISSDLEAHLRNFPSCPREPIVEVLRALRKSLELVGFSETTFNAGRVILDDTSYVLGGEASLLDEVSRFRTRIRAKALEALEQSEGEANGLKAILDLCDEARNATFPAIGVDLFDGQDETGWKYCLPREQSVAISSGETRPSPQLQEITLDQLFKVGQYKGMFSKFDNAGFPILMSDGSPLSNRMQKKLSKKRDKHAQRLQKQALE